MAASKRVSELDRKLKYIFDVAEFEKDARPVKWSLMNSHHDIGNVRNINEISMNGVIAE